MRSTVHPHASGDISAVWLDCEACLGSPPRKWGHLRLSTLASSTARFTPTQVGTSSTVSSWPVVHAVHPHASGDILRSRMKFSQTFGSPPRKWGHPAGGRARATGRRFTPTQVGTSGRPNQSRRAPPVHPHASGDIAIAASRSLHVLGSPPRKWGHLADSDVKTPQPWFTPTQVGTSTPLRDTSISLPVHPHASGDI